MVSRFIVAITTSATLLSAVWWMESSMNSTKFEADFLSSDEFYRKFKVFKENIHERGPELLVSSLKDHIFETPTIKVSIDIS